ARDRLPSRLSPSVRPGRYSLGGVLDLRRLPRRPSLHRPHPIDLLGVSTPMSPTDQIRVWLDDDLVDRQAPDGWTQGTTGWDAIELLKAGTVVELSLDHDLSDGERFGRGTDVVDFIAAEQEMHGRDLWPRDGISLHTANPAGREAMARTIRRYAEKGG